jgi:hypothetical protein
MDVAALDKLAEVASAVATHLDLVQAQSRLQRSEEMVRGLGQFVDGKASTKSSFSTLYLHSASKYFLTLRGTFLFGKRQYHNSLREIRASKIQYPNSPTTIFGSKF